jgi:hypothetical protein
MRSRLFALSVAKHSQDNMTGNDMKDSIAWIRNGFARASYKRRVRVGAVDGDSPGPTPLGAISVAKLVEFV